MSEKIYASTIGTEEPSKTVDVLRKELEAVNRDLERIGELAGALRERLEGPPPPPPTATNGSAGGAPEILPLTVLVRTAHGLTEDILIELRRLVSP